jgi:hypothetical protein
MQHDTAVTNVPVFSSFDLLSRKSIIKTQFIIGIGFVVIHMSIGIIEAVILVIGNADHAVLSSKGVSVIDIEVLVGKFDGPIGQVFAVK